MRSEGRRQQADDSIVVMATSRRTKHRFFEHGSTLITSLIILILLMLLGVASITTSDTQFKLAGNLQFEDAAMNNAETSVSSAETWLAVKTVANFTDAGFTTRSSTSPPQLYPINALTADPLTMIWDDTNSVQVTDTTGLVNPNQRYLIEQMSVNASLITSGQGSGGRGSTSCTKVNTYRITARGESRRGAVRFVQSFFSVLLNNNGGPCSS